jgi:hypothetical protein
MSVATPPPPLGSSWKIWGERLTKYLTSNRNTLQHKDADSKATENGILMWDEAEGTLVVSKNNAWVKIELDP